MEVSTPLVISIFGRASYGIAVLAGFLVGMLVGSISYHYISAKRKILMAWIAGITASAAIGALMGLIAGRGAPAAIALGAIGGVIGSVIGILH